MFLRKIGAVVAIIACIGILLFSYMNWKDKIESAGTKPAEASAPAEVKEEKDEEKKEPVEEDIASIDIDGLTNEMDEQVREVFMERNDSEEKLQLLIVGSEAMDEGSPGYAQALTESLEEAYGDFVGTDVVSFDGTSAEFLDEETDLSAGYDVVLMEPFTLNNNGIVEIEAEHEHIMEFFDSVQAEESDAVLVLHPPQPIYGAQFYKSQVTALQEFAIRNDFAYINHWAEWPDTEDETVKEYLDDDSNPNNDGAVIWADALTAYFIAE